MGSFMREKHFLPSVATMSLGDSKLHSLPLKLQAAVSKGFLGIELYWDDLFEYSRLFLAQSNINSDLAVLLAAAEIATLCKKIHLKVVSLQPFRNFDGLQNQELRNKRLDEFRLWLAVAHRLSAQMIGVPATLPTVDCRDDYTGRKEAAARDIRELARLAEPYGIQVAYENLCFSAYVRDWDQVWERIQLAGEPENLVFLPDTFNICGRTFMDPEENGGVRLTGEVDLAASMEKLVKTIPMERMPLLQVADAELPDMPLIPDHPWRKDSGLAPLMALSRNARLFPYEPRGYLPVGGVIRALVGAGWSGWVSMEIFSRTTRKEGEATVWEHVERAWRAWEKLAGEMRWEVRPACSEMPCSDGD